MSERETAPTASGESGYGSAESGGSANYGTEGYAEGYSGESYAAEAFTIDPLHQFQVRRLSDVGREFLGQPVSDAPLAFYELSNIALWMLVSTLLAFLVLRAVRGGGLVPTRWQSIGEVLYSFISNMVSETAGKAAKPYFPFVLTLFLFILMGNLLGMAALLGWQFTITSQIILTGTLALAVFVLVTVVGFARHGFGFFRLFVPQGAPWWVLPLLVPLEVFSFLVRPLSLAVRLFANMLAGHALVKVLASMIPLVLTAGFGLTSALAVGPMLLLIPITGLEFMVAGIQAYVFAILTCVYLHDSLHLH